jgi:hypothetical protein
VVFAFETTQEPWRAAWRGRAPRPARPADRRRPHGGERVKRPALVVREDHRLRETHTTSQVIGRRSTSAR